MEFKNVLQASSLVLMALLMFTPHTIADDKCYQQCLGTCQLLPQLCAQQCIGQCPPQQVAQVKKIDTTAADPSCYQNCLGTCQLLLQSCVNLCIGQCTSQQVESVDANHCRYCNIRCSVDNCIKHKNDKKKMGNCMHDCSNKCCKNPNRQLP